MASIKKLTTISEHIKMREEDTYRHWHFEQKLKLYLQHSSLPHFKPTEVPRSKSFCGIPTQKQNPKLPVGLLYYISIDQD